MSVQARGGGVLQLNERGIRLQVKGEQDRVRRLEVVATEVALRLLRFDATEADELRLVLRSIDERLRALLADVVTEHTDRGGRKGVSGC